MAATSFLSLLGFETRSMKAIVFFIVTTSLFMTESKR